MERKQDEWEKCWAGEVRFICMLTLASIQTKIDHNNLFVSHKHPSWGISLTCIRIPGMSWIREVRLFVSTGLGLLILVDDQANKRDSLVQDSMHEPDDQLHKFFLNPVLVYGAWFCKQTHSSGLSSPLVWFLSAYQLFLNLECRVRVWLSQEMPSPIVRNMVSPVCKQNNVLRSICTNSISRKWHVVLDRKSVV